MAYVSPSQYLKSIEAQRKEQLFGLLDEIKPMTKQLQMGFEARRQAGIQAEQYDQDMQQIAGMYGIPQTAFPKLSPTDSPETAQRLWKAVFDTNDTKRTILETGYPWDNTIPDSDNWSRSAQWKRDRDVADSVVDSELSGLNRINARHEMLMDPGKTPEEILNVYGVVEQQQKIDALPGLSAAEKNRFRDQATDYNSAISAYNRARAMSASVLRYSGKSSSSGGESNHSAPDTSGLHRLRKRFRDLYNQQVENELLPGIWNVAYSRPDVAEDYLAKMQELQRELSNKRKARERARANGEKTSTADSNIRYLNEEIRALKDDWVSKSTTYQKQDNNASSQFRLGSADELNQSYPQPSQGSNRNLKDLDFGFNMDEYE